MSIAPGTFRERVAAGIANLPVIQAVHDATLRKVDQRAAGMAALHDGEALRSLAARIRRHTLSCLPQYLNQFIERFTQLGGQVHLAKTHDDARRIICEIATARGLRCAVKSKSMTSEEIHLNAAMQVAGLEVFETDLGEFIVQLDNDRPSHIVTPIIHKSRQDSARVLSRALGCEYTEDPRALTQIARAYLRDVFRRCDLGISGVNFAVAETGAICLCTNEGNGRMTVSRPRVHVALMGIEKVIPRTADLAVLLKLLSRSSTGQPMTVYTTLVEGPRRADERDGPDELHLVLLDAGRSALLPGPEREVLACIRCGACLNACPVYRNIGGHAYGGVYPGPIGSLVMPLLQGVAKHGELASASSLCGACYAACPVKIDIPAQLVRLRARSWNTVGVGKRWAMWAWRLAMTSPMLYRLGQRLLRWAPRRDGWIRSGPGPLRAWTRSRDLRAPASRSFLSRWKSGLRDELS